MHCKQIFHVRTTVMQAAYIFFFEGQWFSFKPFNWVSNPVRDLGLSLSRNEEEKHLPVWMDVKNNLTHQGTIVLLRVSRAGQDRYPKPELEPKTFIAAL